MSDERVEFENEKVRVLRIRYGSPEKSVMHGHPDGVLACLTGFRGRRMVGGAKRQGGNHFNSLMKAPA